ncbi:HD domain-containing protein [Nonomuraea sp. SYSU D8015]|uniref:HD domain-containing protein n=1 Tax=Nonomuraea sp. SYSU D8015 TaxID=2593644 RepID=UPI001660AC28|nr:HD domain-containing protein [Nonomuraea sp. SYSU D8015]
MDESTRMVDDDLLALPDSATAREALDWIRRIEPEWLVNHSVRSFLFARLLARHRRMRPGKDYDPELLFLACVLHDVGLTDEGNGSQRFEVDGADLAADFVAARGFDAEAVDTVWKAIALHTSFGIVDRCGAVCALLHGGTVIDITANGSECISDAEAQLIHDAYPRRSAVRQLLGAIGDQVVTRPEKGPVMTLPAELARLRSVNELTRFEDQMIAASRWGS